MFKGDRRYLVSFPIVSAVALALTLASGIVQAQEKTNVQASGEDGGLAAPSESPAAAIPPPKPKVAISTEDCRRLVEHIPMKGAEYQAGVDVRGKKVESADIGGTRKPSLPAELTFDVGPDIRNYLAKPGDLAEMQAKVGTLIYNMETGRLTFNGQPLSDPDQADMAAKCRQALGYN